MRCQKRPFLMPDGGFGLSCFQLQIGWNCDSLSTASIYQQRRSKQMHGSRCMLHVCVCVRACVFSCSVFAVPWRPWWGRPSLGRRCATVCDRPSSLQTRPDRKWRSSRGPGSRFGTASWCSGKCPAGRRCTRLQTEKGKWWAGCLSKHGQEAPDRNTIVLYSHAAICTILSSF